MMSIQRVGDGEQRCLWVQREAAHTGQLTCWSRSSSCLGPGPLSSRHLCCLIFLLPLNLCPVFLLRAPAVGPDGKPVGRACGGVWGRWGPGVAVEALRPHLRLRSPPDRCACLQLLMHLERSGSGPETQDADPSV